MRFVAIKNDSGVMQTIIGRQLQDGEQYRFLTYGELERFRNDEANIVLVNNQELIVVKESGDVTDLSLAMEWLFQDNPSEIQLKERTESQQIPKVAIYESEGDFDSVVSHNFADNSTWDDPLNSEFWVLPDAGKVKFLRKAEVQFTHDIELAGITELYFDILAYNPADLPNRILVQRITYASIKDVLNFGNAHFTMPAVDNLTSSVTTVQFNYPRSIPLNANQGLAVRLSTQNNLPCNGQFVTVSFVTAQEDL